MKIKIIAVGKIKETYFKCAINEYVKRLIPYVNIEIVEVDDISIPLKCNETIENKIKVEECSKILAKLKQNDFVIGLDLNRKMYDSVEFSNELFKWFVKGNSSLTFVIGGSLGLSDDLKKRCNAFLTISNMTFTHQMCRVILLEQIYRGFKIHNNETYHK